MISGSDRNNRLTKKSPVFCKLVKELVLRDTWGTRASMTGKPLRPTWFLGTMEKLSNAICPLSESNPTFEKLMVWILSFKDKENLSISMDMLEKNAARSPSTNLAESNRKP